MKNIFKKVLCSVAVAFSCVFAAKVADAQTVYMGIQVEAKHSMRNLDAGNYIGVCLIGSGSRALAQIIRVVGHHLLVRYDDTTLDPPKNGTHSFYISGPYNDAGVAVGTATNYYRRKLFSTYDAVEAFHRADNWTSLYSWVPDAGGNLRYEDCRTPYDSIIQSRVVLNTFSELIY